MKHTDGAHTPRKDAKASPMEGGEGENAIYVGGRDTDGGVVRNGKKRWMILRAGSVVTQATAPKNVRHHYT